MKESNKNRIGKRRNNPTTPKNILGSVRKKNGQESGTAGNFFGLYMFVELSGQRGQIYVQIDPSWNAIF